MAGLTPKQEMFCKEYLIDLNATQAAIRAGYSVKTATEQSSRLLTNVNVAEYLSAATKARTERTQIDADYVLTRLAEIDRMEVSDILNDDGTMKAVKDWPKVWRQSISGMDVSEIFLGSGDERVLAGLLKKVKYPDKLKNLELIGKHVSVGAFKDSIDHKHSFIGPDGKPFEFKVVTEYVSPGENKNG